MGFKYYKGEHSMDHLYIPTGYTSELGPYDTPVALKTVKDFFSRDSRSSFTYCVFLHLFSSLQNPVLMIT